MALILLLRITRCEPVEDGRGALLSECGQYRYRLWRLWDALAPVMVWVLLNPSTADADTDDPTVRKCVGFARAHRYGGVVLVNLFAWRATDPKQLRIVNDPVGPKCKRGRIKPVYGVTCSATVLR
jgi:hypothetical protein